MTVSTQRLSVDRLTCMGLHWHPYGLMHIHMYNCKYLCTTLGVYIKGNRDVILPKIVKRRMPDQDKGAYSSKDARRAQDTRSLGILLMEDCPSSRSDDISGFRLSESES